MSRWLPSAAEERWLAVAARLRPHVAPNALDVRAGGWRGVRPLARAALFVLGTLAALLALAVLGFDDDPTMLLAGLLAIGAGEALKVSQRLHAAGIEEGLWAAGAMLVATWIGGEAAPAFGHATVVWWFVILVATATAGARLLNPLLTTCAVLAGIEWLAALAPARVIDASSGSGTTGLVVGSALAAGALWLGGREYRRPSVDRMLDWLVVVLPLFAYARYHGAYVVGPGLGLHASRPLTIVALLALAGSMALAGRRRRRRAPLLGLLGCLACLAVEFANLVGGPAEAWLIGYGCVAIMAASLLERRFQATRDGITSARLDDRDDLFGELSSTLAAAVAARTSTALEPAVPEERPAPGRDGRFGGAGASGRF